MSSEQIIFLYTTTTSKENADRLCQILLEEKLIACANGFPMMQAWYWWEGKIHNNTECALILKTTSSCVEKLKNRLRDIHPYQVPCFAEIEIEKINADYKNWLLSNLSP